MVHDSVRNSEISESNRFSQVGGGPVYNEEYETNRHHHVPSYRREIYNQYQPRLSAEHIQEMEEIREEPEEEREGPFNIWGILG